MFCWVIEMEKCKYSFNHYSFLQYLEKLNELNENGEKYTTKVQDMRKNGSTFNEGDPEYFALYEYAKLLTK